MSGPGADPSSSRPGADPSSSRPGAPDSVERRADSAIVSLVASLADNKAALGRRYGEWAISAPTIESAVALAAMAQDEIGHGRSTYPVLAKLGVHRGDALEGGRPLSALEHELPDWASVIAANLVIDGILTTFLASARTSSIEPLAQRARKVLQEEGSHRLHAESWLRRLCRGARSDRDLLLERIGALWSQAARWGGPADDPGYRAAVAEGALSEGPEWVRGRVRAWLDELLHGEGLAVQLDEPKDWSGWDPVSRR